MAMLAALSAIASIAGTVVSAAGTIAAGKAQQQAAEYQAKQQELKAKEEQAAAQRDAEQYKRKKELTLSTLQTKAAGSGFSASDPTSLALADEITKYGTYQEQLAMYGGTSRAAGLESQAMLSRMEGKAKMSAARSSATGTILGGISSMAGRSYG